MQAFEYANPKTVKEAVALLGATWADAAVLAGGTDLLSLMKDFVMSPRRLVNIKGIAELKGITKTAAGLRIGAAATVDELLSSPLVRASYPSLTEAARGISSPQIRNMGTVGGDLCQRPRCWYFRTGHGLLAMHNGRSLVAEGDGRYHAIFPSGNARFVSASSFGPALIALGAKIKIAGPDGTREAAAADFFVSPASDGDREIAIKPNEIVTEILIPAAVTKNATYEVRQKEALDWPLATASVALKMKGTAVAEGRVVLGHVAPTPYHAKQASEWLAGKTIDASAAAAAAEEAVRGAQPLDSNAYKVQLAKTAVKRALLAAAGIKAV
jgi:xanthine dehydrogenase YagS FAD-binding subunit